MAEEKEFDKEYEAFIAGMKAARRRPPFPPPPHRLATRHLHLARRGHRRAARRAHLAEDEIESHPRAALLRDVRARRTAHRARQHALRKGIPAITA